MSAFVGRICCCCCCCCCFRGRQAPPKQLRKQLYPSGSSARRRNTGDKLDQRWPLQEEQTALLFQDDNDNDDDSNNNEHDLMVTNYYDSTSTNEKPSLLVDTTTTTTTRTLVLSNLWQAICRGALTEPLLDSLLRECPEKFSILHSSLSEDGRRAIDWAACRGQAAMLQLLLEYTSEHAIYTFEDDTATKRDAIYKCIGPRGCTVLHWAASAASSSSVDCCRILLQRGGQRLLHQPNHRGETVLFYATATSMSFLLTTGANPQMQDDQGRTVLHSWAARRENGQSRKVVRLVLARNNASHGPENLVHLTDHNDDTALHVAARHGHQEVARLLLQHGANLKATNANGHTALEVARRSLEWGMASWLRAQFPHFHDQPSGTMDTKATTINLSRDYG